MACFCHSLLLPVRGASRDFAWETRQFSVRPSPGRCVPVRRTRVSMRAKGRLAFGFQRASPYRGSPAGGSLARRSCGPRRWRGESEPLSFRFGHKKQTGPQPSAEVVWGRGRRSLVTRTAHDVGAGRGRRRIMPGRSRTRGGGRGKREEWGREAGERREGSVAQLTA